jgi:hypothetical protein
VLKEELFLLFILSTPLFSFDEFSRIGNGSSVQGPSYEQCLAGCYQNSNDGNIKACVNNALNGICTTPYTQATSPREPEIIQNSPGNELNTKPRIKATFDAFSREIRPMPDGYEGGKLDSNGKFQATCTFQSGICVPNKAEVKPQETKAPIAGFDPFPMPDGYVVNKLDSNGRSQPCVYRRGICEPL